MESGEHVVGMESGERRGHGMEGGERYAGYGAGKSFLDLMMDAVNGALQQFQALSPAGRSLFVWHAAAQAGKFVTVSSNGGYVDPNAGSIDTNGIVYANGQTWGYAVGITDAPKHGVSAVIQDVEAVGTAVGTAVSAAASFVENLPSELAGGVVALAGLIVSAVEAMGADLGALVQLGEWFIDFLGDLLGVLDPTVSASARSAALSRLSPTHQGSALYRLFTDPTYEKGLALACLIVALPAVLFFDGVARPLLNHISPRFADLLSPTHLADTVIAMVGGLLEGLAQHRPVFEIVKDLVEGYLASLAITVSPAAVVKIAYACITGPFLPPLPAIAAIIAADPVFQKSADQTLGTGDTIQHLLPVAMACFDAADAASWLTCFEGILSDLFPGIISGLASMGVSAHDLRVLVQAVWESGGDFDLVLNEAHFPGIHDAVMGLGFYGVGWVAHAVNGVTHAFNGYGAYSAVNFAAAEDFFLTVVLPVLDNARRAQVQAAYDIFNFALEFLAEGGQVSTDLGFDRLPGGWPLYLLRTFNESHWDVEVAFGRIVADEFDPASPHFFASNVHKVLGQPVFTPALQGLWGKVRADFPRSAYQLAALEVALGLHQSPELPKSTQVASTSRTGVSTSGTLHISTSNAGLTLLPVGAGGQSVTGKAPAAKPEAKPATGLNWAALLGTAATGYLVAKTPGALAGAAAGLLFPGKIPAQKIPGLPGDKKP